MLRRKKKNTQEKKIIDMDLGARALAKAVKDGDLVNFRVLFAPFSPLREDSSEILDSTKYRYLHPDEQEEQDPEFIKALEMIREEGTWNHILNELKENRPAQLPAALVMRLGDNAVRQGKYTMASQAYELLRIRAAMQNEFFRQGDVALDEGDIRRAVQAYIIATGLEYNYAAFPEPLPQVPDFQNRALILHGEYPENLEDTLPMQELKPFLQTAFTYLLLSPSAAARLANRPLSVQVDFLVELVHQRDPRWQAFAERYRKALDYMEEFRERIQSTINRKGGQPMDLADEIAEILGEDPMKTPAMLLGWSIDQGEWWQYLKELAFVHPPAPLFLARQLIGETEIIVPMLRADSPIPARLNLVS